MAAADALDAKPAAPGETIGLQGIHHVFRTGRKKTAAAAGQRADDILIDADQANQQLVHRVTEGPIGRPDESAGRASDQYLRPSPQYPAPAVGKTGEPPDP